MLLDAGADPNNRQRHGYTPLHSAAANGDLESIDLLLETGADPAATNDDGETALVLAEREDDLVIVERLRDATA
jgi:ankyrin repeat protein